MQILFVKNLDMIKALLLLTEGKDLVSNNINFGSMICIVTELKIHYMIARAVFMMIYITDAYIYLNTHVKV